MIPQHVTTANAADPLISVRNLWIGYDSAGQSTLAVRGVSLDLTRGMKLGIVGESGSGKSTAALALVGLLPATARILRGAILHKSRDVTHAPEEIWAAIRGGETALVFQNAMASLHPLYTVGAQLSDVFQKHSAVPRSDAARLAEDIMSAMGIPDAARRARAYPHQYSGGMAQRALVGLALACSPDVLLADEPTSGLDPMIQIQVLEVINRRVSDARAALVLISHDISAIRQICTDVVVMYAGEVMERGTAKQVLTEPRGPYTQALLRSHDISGGLSGGFEYIPGKVPTITPDFAGCSFSGRCPLEASLGHPTRCRTELPQLRAVGPAQEAACHFLEHTAHDVPSGPVQTGSISRRVQTDTPAPDPILRAAGVSKSFHASNLVGGRRQVQALDDVSISVYQNRILAVIGESGSGKSTLGKVLAGLADADQGDVEFRSRPITRQSRRDADRFRRSVQIVFQNPLRSFNPMLTVGSSLKDPLRLIALKGKPAEHRVGELLESVGLPSRFASRHPHQLSGGELQRASIARALATDPEVLILDEPTSALDVSVRGQVINVLLNLRLSRQLAMVLISHELRVVRAMADSVAVMYLGQIVESGPAQVVLSRPEHPYTRALLATAFGSEEPWRGQAGDWTAITEIAPLQSHYTGCRLAPRCRFALDACNSPQALLIRGDGRGVRCWRVDEIPDVPAMQEQPSASEPDHDGFAL